MSQGTAESAVKVLDPVLELQQLLAGSATSFTEFVLCEAGSATRFTEFILYEAESGVKFKVESTFDLFANTVFCVVCSFVASLSMLWPHQEKVQGFYLFPFPIQHRYPHPKCFPQQCQGHSPGQSRIIIKSIYLWVARSVLTDP